jgi:NTP pyrophosphatase (non-canonical NTP hydrolase)
MTFKELKPLIEQWFIDRDLHTKESGRQLIKLEEEMLELKQAYKHRNREEVIDAIGDITVVLIGFCLQQGLDYEACIEAAYHEIKNRKGKVVNGIFVKEEK